MKQVKTLKKLVCLLLAFVTLLSMAACKDGTDEVEDPDEPTQAPELVKLENAYAETLMQIDTKGRIGSSLAYAGGRVYFDVSEDILGEDGQSITGWATRIVSVLPDGSDAQILWEMVTPNEFATADAETAMSEMAVVGTASSVAVDGPRVRIASGSRFASSGGGSAWLQSFTVSPDGSLWIIIRSDKYDEETEIYSNETSLVKYAADGTELGEVSLDNIEGVEYFYPQSINLDSAGNLYVSDNYNVIIVVNGETLEIAFSLSSLNEGGDEYMQNITRTNDGKIIGVFSGREGMAFKTLDFEAKSFGEPVKYPGGYFYDIYPGNAEYSIYYRNQDNIYGLNLSTMEAVPVVNFINSDIDSQTVSRIIPMDNAEFLIYKYDYYTNNAIGEMYHLVENKEATLQGKVMLTLGTIYTDERTRRAVLYFNKNSQNARISIVNYESYNTSEDYTLAQTQLDMDILAGKAPDIINMQQLQVAKYASKGVLEDLQPFFDTDPGLKREDMFENILDLGVIDGKMYNVIPSFYITTLVGKESVFGNATGLTTSEFLEIVKKYPDAEILPATPASEWLRMSIALGLSDYINWMDGTCNFDNPEFIAALEFAKRFPKEIDYESLYGDDYMTYQSELEAAYKNNKALLVSRMLDNIRIARDLETIFGEKVAFIGYPSANGGGGVVNPSCSYAISSKSSSKDAAWEFLSMMLSGEYIPEGNSRMMWDMTINKKTIMEKAAIEMTPILERDFTNGLEMRESTFNGSSMWTYSSPEEVEMPKYENYALTQEEVDKVINAISSASSMVSTDEKVMQIILEEADVFLSGTKTAEETARIIQSRVSIYVAENS